MPKKKKSKSGPLKAIAAATLRLQSKLRPYQSYHVFKDPSVRDKDRVNLLDRILDDAITLTKLDSDETVVDNHRSSPNRVPEAPTGLLICWHTYVKERSVAWANIDAGIRDRVNHIVIVAAASNHLSITTSDKALAGRIDRLKSGSTDAPALSKLVRASHDALESALVSGNARILWMSGIHRDRAIRPNAKVLMGSNLNAALDPLSDQTFHYTSVRTDGPGTFGSAAPGVSPRKARVWLTSSQKLEDFTTRTQVLLKAIDSSSAKSAPFPILARPVTDINDVKNAFDFALLPSEGDQAYSEDKGTDYDLANNVKWSLKGNPKSSGVVLAARHEGIDYKVNISFSASSGATVTRILPLPATVEHEDLHEEIQASLRLFDSDFLKVYFDSGHTYSSGSMFLVATRPVPFVCQTDKFTNTVITLEKPQKNVGNKTALALDAIGLPGDQSLFSWLFRRQKRGWLWCDDGSGEIADFIHIADDDTVTLFHLKGAQSLTGNVSVGAYEVVCAQALKNLKMLEQEDMVDVLAKRMKAAPAHSRCWHNGRRAKDEKAFLKRVQDVRYATLTPRVVVVQPHVSYSRLPKTEAELAKGTQTVHRAKQFHTMLNGFAATFRNLGITFEVIVKE